MSQSMYRKVGIATLIMMASVFLSRVIGLVREMAIAYIGGIGGGVDAYQVAFIIPEILNHVLASGFLSITFIPIFTHYLAENQEEEGWQVFSIILTTFGSLLLLLMIVAMVLAPWLVRLLAPGLEDPVRLSAAIRMTRIIIPAQFFFFCGGLLMAVQFAREKFFIPALAPLLYNAGIIAGGALLGHRLGMEGFSWGVLAGAFLGNFAVQVYGARKVGLRFAFRFYPTHPDLIRYIKLTLPLMIGLTMTFSTEIFLKFFGSFLPSGSIAGLNYGLRVMLMLVGLFGQAAGVASFPFLSQLAASKQLDEMNRLLNTTIRYLGLLLPFSALLMVLRHEVVILLFQRGRFDAAAADLTAQALLFLMTGAFAFAVQTVVVRGFYAMQNTILPTAFGTLAVLFSLPIYWLGLHFMDVAGVAFAISLSAILQVTVLYIVWNRKSGNKDSRMVYGFYGRMLLWAMVLGGLFETVRRFLHTLVSANQFAANLIISLVVGFLFLICLMAVGKFFNISEIAVFTSRVKARLLRRS